MGYAFDVADATVWSPSLNVGATYVAMTQTFASLGGLDTGLTTITDDTYEIAPPAFSDLVRYWFDRFSSTTHPIYRALIRGWLLTSLVLLERAGMPIQPTTDEQRSITTEAKDLSRSMPT